MKGETLIKRAQELAHVAHDLVGQRRKYTHEPYWVHTDAVATTAQEYGCTPIGIAVAHLHDFIEDPISMLVKQGRWQDRNKLLFEFSKFPIQVRTGVEELTHFYTSDVFPDWSRARRKDAEAVRLGNASPENKTVKLADLLNNTESIVEHDPGFARVYLREKQITMEYLKDGDHRLYRRVIKQLKESLDKLAMV